MHFTDQPYYGFAELLSRSTSAPFLNCFGMQRAHTCYRALPALVLPCGRHFDGACRRQLGRSTPRFDLRLLGGRLAALCHQPLSRRPWPGVLNEFRGGFPQRIAPPVSSTRSLATLPALHGLRFCRHGVYYAPLADPSNRLARSVSAPRVGMICFVVCQRAV